MTPALVIRYTYNIMYMSMHEQACYDIRTITQERFHVMALTCMTLYLNKEQNNYNCTNSIKFLANYMHVYTCMG